MFSGKSILVTGGTGSFGKAFIKSVLQRYDVARLIVFSRDELKQYEMQQDPEIGERQCLRYFLGDVRDKDRLNIAFHGVDYVVHAAALKHVPAAEYNPFECIRTNVFGAENVVNASIQQGVKAVIALSTDKAANPANLYGASKLASDRIFIAGNNLGGANGPRFSVVRYGNVLGSRGSVLPLFQRLVREGKDIPITDERMTRFWITLQQGVDFVLSCFPLLNGGEIFIPKLPSMRVVDLARGVAGPDTKFTTVGIRPGEKIHEVMVTEDDARLTLELPDRYIIQPSFQFHGRTPTAYPNAVPVAAEFRYSSDGNTDWLTPERLRDLIAGM